MRWILLSLLATLVASCGQKGPLYLPEESALDNLHVAALLGGTPDAH